MTYPTRFIILAPSDYSAQPSDLNRLTTLAGTLGTWVADKLDGKTYAFDPPIIVKSNFTLAELLEDPYDRIQTTLTSELDDGGLEESHTATIVIAIAFPPQFTEFGGGIFKEYGFAILDDAPLIALRGDPPPPGTPPLMAEYWPNAAYGVLIHEMIHAWGGMVHTPGIMSQYYLYPNTTIAPETQAVLFDSPFITAPLNPFALISNLHIECQPTGILVTFDTEIMTNMQIVYSPTPPTSRRHYKEQRGVRVFCYYTWKIPEPQVVNEATLENTHHHELFIPGWPQCSPVYFYIRRRFRAEIKSTKTPIMTAHCTPVTCWEEPWDGPLTKNHPWTCEPPVCPNPDEPKDGLLHLYGLPGGHNQFVENDFWDADWITAADPYSLFFNWEVPEHSSTHWTGTAMIYVFYVDSNNEHYQRWLIFDPFAQDCSYKDYMAHFNYIAGISPALSYSGVNLGVLYHNPPKYCKDQRIGPNPRVTHIRLEANPGSDAEVKMFTALLRICYQDPTPTHPRYEPTHPG